MNARDDRDRNQGQDTGSPGPAETDLRDAKTPRGPSVVETDDPAITPGPPSRSAWDADPDRTEVIETNRILGPNEAYNPRLVVVPVVAQPAHAGQPRADRDRREAHDNGRESAQRSHPKSDQHPEQEKSSSYHGERGRNDSRHGPSLVRILVFAGILSLVCGVVGAWAYSSLAGSGKSDDKKSSSKKSDKDSDSDTGSDSSKKDESSQKDKDEAHKLLQAEAAWMTAVKDLHEARDAERSAHNAEADSKAILKFFKNTLLSAGHSGETSLTQAFWTSGQGKDLSLRKAVDMAESQVSETFTDRPLAEATVREMLGLAYLNLGDASQATHEYERALALREAMQGGNASDTADCRNQLAIAYRLAGRPAEGGRLFERNPNSASHAAALAVRGAMLLVRKQPAEAELKLRECLAIREKVQPDDWTTFETRSVLGEALLDQNKLSDAEPLLLSGYDGMKKHSGNMSAQDKQQLNKAAERLVRLYESWGKKEEALRWRNELEMIPVMPNS